MVMNNDTMVVYILGIGISVIGVVLLVIGVGIGLIIMGQGIFITYLGVKNHRLDKEIRSWMDYDDKYGN